MNIASPPKVQAVPHPQFLVLSFPSFTGSEPPDPNTAWDATPIILKFKKMSEDL